MRQYQYEDQGRGHSLGNSMEPVSGQQGEFCPSREAKLYRVICYECSILHSDNCRIHIICYFRAPGHFGQFL